MSDSPDRGEAIKRSVAYSFLPAIIAATSWDAGILVMLGIFAVLLPFEVALVWIGDLIARSREKRSASRGRLDLR